MIVQGRKTIVVGKIEYCDVLVQINFFSPRASPRRTAACFVHNRYSTRRTDKIGRIRTGIRCLYTTVYRYLVTTGSENNVDHCCEPENL